DERLVSQFESRAALSGAASSVTTSCAWPVQPVSRSGPGRPKKLTTSGSGFGSTHGPPGVVVGCGEPPPPGVEVGPPPGVCVGVGPPPPPVCVGVGAGAPPLHSTG